MRRLMTMMAAAAVLAPLEAGAHDVKAGELTLSNLQVRASLGANPNTAAYLTVANRGSKPDRLLSIACACAAKVEAHRSMSHDDGRAMMMAAGPVAIPAGGRAEFKPGGMHLMLTGLRAPLKDGAMQEMTLRFERASAIRATFAVTSRITAAPMESRP